MCIGVGPWGRKESDTTERLHFHFHRCGGSQQVLLEVPHGVWDHVHDAHRSQGGDWLPRDHNRPPPTPISFELEDPGEMPGNLAKVIIPWDLNQVYVVLKFPHVCGPV